MAVVAVVGEEGMVAVGAGTAATAAAGGMGIGVVDTAARAVVDTVVAVAVAVAVGTVVAMSGTLTSAGERDWLRRERKKRRSSVHGSKENMGARPKANPKQASGSGWRRLNEWTNEKESKSKTVKEHRRCSRSFVSFRLLLGVGGGGRDWSKLLAGWRKAAGEFTHAR
jgi:mannitol-specific phosphotransferase system IIBC component